jgi:hypothetical protein
MRRLASETYAFFVVLNFSVAVVVARPASLRRADATRAEPRCVRNAAMTRGTRFVEVS